MPPGSSAVRFLTHYEALDVRPSASTAEIKKQFYKLSKQFHPDRVLSGSDIERASARTRFDALTEAYSVLGDPSRRQEYDGQLHDERTAASQDSANSIYRTPGEKRQHHYSGLNRTRQRSNAHYGDSSEEYFTAFGKKVPKGSHPVNMQNTGLGAGYATGLNNDVPHFDYDKYVKQQLTYEQFRAQRDKVKHHTAPGLRYASDSPASPYENFDSSSYAGTAYQDTSSTPKPGQQSFAGAPRRKYDTDLSNHSSSSNWSPTKLVGGVVGVVGVVTVIVNIMHP
ncbi:uncharacterized protein V1516DRAFT_669025 [Lipomyces oligophaga]|uniref:uncharacterized protein n=1 Tax=Lipomyces oligophaga TaxID=45792 RepID=UPI0034CE8ED2